MNSGNAAGDIAFWAGDTHANRASAAFRVEMDGSVIASDIAITGGTTGGWNITSTHLYNLQSGTPDSSPSDGIVLDSDEESLIIYENTQERVRAGFLSTGVYGLRVFADDGSTVIFEASDTQILMSGIPIAGIPNSTATDISLLTLTHDLVFSVTDADTIAWASGTITMSNGRTFSIVSGNTGNMAALTYIYLDPAVSSTVLQTTTTYSTAIGADKAHIGTAQNQTVTAFYIPATGGGQLLVDGSQIGALSIVAGNIAASTITAGKMSVSNLAAINADLGTVTAGSVFSGLFSTSTSGATDQRIVINTSDDTLKYFNSANQEMVNLGVAGLHTMNLRRTGTTSIAAFFTDLDADDINTAELIRAIILGTSSTGPVYYGQHDGLGYAAEFAVGVNASRTNATVRIRASSGQGPHLELEPIADAPQTPSEGDIYADTDHFAYYHDGTALRAFILNGPAQTVAGVFTFTSFPVTPSSAPTTDFQVANKKYVDDAAAIDSQVFTSDGTWTKASGVTFVQVVVIGAGGGGGSGEKAADATTRVGGSGGGGGAVTVATFLASTLGATESITVGALGAGGAAQSTNSSNGNAGNNGGSSSFGTWLAAGGGGSGTGGSGSGPIASGGGGGSLTSASGSTAGTPGVAADTDGIGGQGTTGGTTNGDNAGIWRRFWWAWRRWNSCRWHWWQFYICLWWWRGR